jgi:hypothetical protein
LPKINNTFILVSGDSDICVPKEALTNLETARLINSPYLIKWFAQNTQVQNHPKMVQLPIGLDYHTISRDPNHHWKTDGEGHLPRFQEGLLIKLREEIKPFYEREPKIYVNFSIATDRFHQRQECFQQIPHDLMVINQNFTKRTETWKNITNYSFVLSPFGNGMDCHRTWEALCLGCIPIVKTSGIDRLFNDLPVLIVKEWKDLTPELLNKTVEEFKNKSFKMEKLTLEYWINLMNNS